MSPPSLILASTSRYRIKLLNRLGLIVRQMPPKADETLLPGEAPARRAARLGSLKARSIVEALGEEKDYLIVASDQVCHMQGQIYRKPGDRHTARQHLSQFSNNWVTFSTSLVLIHDSGQEVSLVEDFSLQFRELSDSSINQYLDIDQPFDCAGAIKVESAGMTLIKDTRGRDLNSVYGMPVMALVDALSSLDLGINDFR